MRHRLVALGLTLALLSAAPLGAIASTLVSPESVHPRLSKASGASDLAAGLSPASTPYVSSAVPLSASPELGSLFGLGERQLYRIFLEPGDRLTLSVTGTEPGVDLYLYGPGTLDVTASRTLAHASVSGYPRVLT